MKKSILIIALALISAVTFAQTTNTTIKKADVVNIGDASAVSNAKTTVKKTETATKPEFKPDYQAPRDFKLSVAEVSYLIMTPEQWGQVEFSKELTGEKIQQMKMIASMARQKLTSQADALIKNDQQKFTADTAAASKKPLKK
jgi:hypothetical protein